MLYQVRGIVHGESERDFDEDVHVEDSLTGGTHCNTYVHMLNDTCIGRSSTPAKLSFLFSNSVQYLIHHGLCQAYSTVHRMPDEACDGQDVALSS